jgi:hypothetical protein
MKHVYVEEVLRCSFHPTEVVIGICALCLRERLLILASKQGNYASCRDTSKKVFPRKTYSLPKVSALGSLLRLEFRNRKSDVTDLDASISLEGTLA